MSEDNITEPMEDPVSDSAPTPESPQSWRLPEDMRATLLSHKASDDLRPIADAIWNNHSDETDPDRIALARFLRDIDSQANWNAVSGFSKWLMIAEALRERAATETDPRVENIVDDLAAFLDLDGPDCQDLIASLRHIVQTGLSTPARIDVVP